MNVIVYNIYIYIIYLFIYIIILIRNIISKLFHFAWRDRKLTIIIRHFLMIIKT